MSVIDLLLRNVAQTPDKPAVIAADGELSFRELDQAAGRIATRLHQRGVRRGDTVAMAMDNAEAAHFTASYFGIHKLGAIPVPMNVRWAAPEKRYVLEHSDAVALICGAEHAAHFAPLSTSSTADGLALRSWLVTGSTQVAGFEALGNLLREGPQFVQLIRCHLVIVRHGFPPVGGGQPCSQSASRGTRQRSSRCDD